MKTKPFKHQADEFELSKDLLIRAIWWEQGTGKSKLIIDTACHLHQSGKITGLLVIAPNGVHGNFVTQEWPVHGWDRVRVDAYVYDSGRSGTKKGQRAVDGVCERVAGQLMLMAISYDALRTKAGFAAASLFLTQHEAMAVCDESTAISEPTTERSKRVIQLGPLAKYRRVMSGTPVAEGPFKIFNQMRFLDPGYWRRHGLTSYFAFKNAFAQFKQEHTRAGQRYHALVRYQNLEYLQRLIAQHSSRVLKEDVLDLPPKLYTKVEYELDSRQRQIYDDLVTTLSVQIDSEHRMEAMTAIVQLTRLQQITSGYVVVDETPPITVGDIAVLRCDGYSIHGEINEIGPSGVGTILGARYVNDQPTEYMNWLEPFFPNDPRLFRLVNANQKTIDLYEKPSWNPRILALVEILVPITTKVIIWARYRKDIDAIMSIIGERAVRYDGVTSTTDRETALRRFREDDDIQYFVANPATISMGVTLTQAKTVIYYSNSFRLEQRLQSEDRAHRIGQTDSVQVIDLIASRTVDEKIVDALRKKFSLAALVTGDRLREWIQ